VYCETFLVLLLYLLLEWAVLRVWTMKDPNVGHGWSPRLNDCYHLFGVTSRPCTCCT